MSRFLLPILLIVLILAGCNPAPLPSERVRVLIVIAPQYCCDEEFFWLKRSCEQKNINMTVAGVTTTEVKGEVFGTTLKPDMTISQIDVDKYDGIVIGSGTGSKEFFWGDENLRQIIRLAFAKNKVLAASCNSPVVLARAGILEGKEATGLYNPDVVRELEAGGAIYRDEAVVIDGNIVTGRDIKGMERFIQTLVEKLLQPQS